MPRNPDKTPCSMPGCRAWAMHGTDPPRCASHSGRTGAPPGNRNHLVHGFYATALRPDELDDLHAHADDSPLDGEIAITRVALRRILGTLLSGRSPGADGQPLDAGEYARYAALAFQGVSTLSRLLRVRHDLEPADDSRINENLAAALDELSKEWGIEL